MGVPLALILGSSIARSQNSQESDLAAIYGAAGGESESLVSARQGGV